MRLVGGVLMIAMTIAGLGCSRGETRPGPADGRTAADATSASADATAPDAAGAPSATDDEATHAACCAQCAGAGKRDPAGMDISTKDCLGYRGEFNGGPGVDERCAAHFEARRTTLGECWQLAPATK